MGDEQQDTYEAPRYGWTCFHCGETFRTAGSARDHFGAVEGMKPGCMIRVQVGEERGLLVELRKCEARLAAAEARVKELEADHDVLYRQLAEQDMIGHKRARQAEAELRLAREVVEAARKAVEPLGPPLSVMGGDMGLLSTPAINRCREALAAYDALKREDK